MNGAADAGPIEPDALRPLWARALREGDTTRALLLRRIERLHSVLDLHLGPVRRQRWLCADACSTTWEGVWVETGQCGRVRVLDPDQQGVLQVPPSTGAVSVGGGRAAAVPLPGPTLRALCADPELLDERTALRWLTSACIALAQGAPTSAPLEDLLVLRSDGLQLIDLGATDQPPASASDALASLAAHIGALPLSPAEPLGSLLRDWTAAPPPSLPLAHALLVQHLSATLAEGRHRLALTRRNRRSVQRRAALRALLERLWSAWRPPRGRYVLSVSADGLMTALCSDGQRLVGGTLEPDRAAAQAGSLPIIFDGQTLDAPRARALLRSWTTRDRGNSHLQAALTATWGDGADPAPVCRWLAGMARLRAARLLLDAAARRSTAP